MSFNSLISRIVGPKLGELEAKFQQCQLQVKSYASWLSAQVSGTQSSVKSFGWDELTQDRVRRPVNGTWLEEGNYQ
jgi:hypothetical protein